MILHTVVFVWKDGVQDEQVDRLDRDLHTLATKVEGVVSFETGRDGKFRDGGADFVLLGRFTDEAALHAYLGHPDHHRMLDDYARAMVARKESVQAQVP